MERGVRAGLIAAAALFAGCGGGSSGGSGGGGGGSGSCTPGQSASVSITSAGLSPMAVCVVPGGTVTFTNHDTVAHDIESTGTCPQLNLGSIAAGQADTAMFPTTATCTFGDATKPGNAAFQGTVAVASAPVTGPGY
jgi:plastocyanin